MAADTGQINYQARLLDSYGRRLNTSVDLSFKIYDAVSDGNLLWSETQAGVVVQDGVYSVILGSQTPIPASAFAQNGIYLELGISGETMTPRQQITASAYSLVARTIMGSNIYENQDSGNVGIGTITPAAKLDVNGAIQATGFKMPTGATPNYVLVSDADGIGTWQSMSIVITESDPIHTNWVRTVFTPATNNIWSAFDNRVLASTFNTATVQLWSAVSARALQSDVSAATNDMWDNGINIRVPLAGGIMTGLLTNLVGFVGNGAGLTNVPSSGVVLTGYVQRAGDTMTGALIVSNNVTVTGTNQVGVLYVTNAIILQDSAAITNWQGLTNTTFDSIYTRRDTGITNIAGGVVTNAQLANGAVTGDKITDGTISNVNIAASTVTGDKITDGTISNVDIAASAVTGDKITDGTISNANIAAGAVADLNITSATNWNNAVVIREGTAGVAISYSNLYYFALGSTWSNACATNSTYAGGLLGIGLGNVDSGAAITNAQGILLNGYCNNAWGFTAGDIIYVSTNTAQITKIRPTGSNHIVRIVGYAVSASRIYFNPDRTYIQIVGQ
ncbi:MAG: hypothetical protein Q7J98_07470 [Kiritimatiellia bacterium]|nr:hypothetical protein [Kiritimatiellia bacterium]